VQVSSDVLERAHASSVDVVATALGVDPAVGLSVAEVDARLRAHGSNELTARRPPSLVHMLWDAVTEPFVVLLLVAGLLAVAVGEVRDGLLVLVGLLPIVGADVVTGYRGGPSRRCAIAAPMASVRAGSVKRYEPRRSSRRRGPVRGDIVPADIVQVPTRCSSPRC
jgi:magnesium-transporting ATPase (P-type)